MINYNAYMTIIDISDEYIKIVLAVPTLKYKIIIIRTLIEIIMIVV